MEEELRLVRAISALAYDPDRQRFKNYVFKYSGGAVSLFDERCGVAESGSVCAHIECYYKGITGTPPLFWRLPVGVLNDHFGEDEVSVVASAGETGDINCHRDVRVSSNSAAQKFGSARCLPPYVYVCWGSTDKAADHAMLASLRDDAIQRIPDDQEGEGD